MPRRRGAPLAGAWCWALTCVLVAFAPPGVVGFSLPGASSPTPAPTPTAEWTFAEQRRGRRAAEAAAATDDSRCATSCDETPNSNCDAQDANGEYKLGCDMHYTTHCDDFSACASPPAPPARPPWQGDGTYPHPPPLPPPSPPAEPLRTAIGLAVLVILLLLLCACCACAARDGPGSPAALCCAKNCPCFTWCMFPYVDRSYVTRVVRADADAGANADAEKQAEKGATEVRYGIESEETLRAMAKARLPLMAMPLSASLAGK